MVLHMKKMVLHIKKKAIMLLHPIITICSECGMLAILSYTDGATVIQLLTHSMRHASSDSIFTSPIPMVALPWPDPFGSPDGPLTQEITLKTVRISTAQRNSMLLPTLPLGGLATRDKP